MITYVKFTRNPGESGEDFIICPIAGGDRYKITSDTSRIPDKKYYLYNPQTDQYELYSEGTVHTNCYDTEYITQNGEPSHGLIIKNIDGLGVDNVSINTSDFAIKDGSYLNGTRWGNRNIVITFLLSAATRGGATNIENARKNLYDYFQGKKKVRVSIKTDSNGAERYIDGYVEYARPEVFSEEEEVEVSLICIDPYFKIRKGVYPTVLGAFTYLGTADAGCNIKLTIQDQTKNPGINGIVFDRTKIVNDQGQSIYTNGGVIELSSERGKKFAKYHVSGPSAPVYDIMNAAGIGPFAWTYLTYGSNTVAITYDGSQPADVGWPEEDIYVDPDNPGATNYYCYIEYNELHGGI